jgi:uncharacterized protein (DUF305 family)
MGLIMPTRSLRWMPCARYSRHSARPCSNGGRASWNREIVANPIGSQGPSPRLPSIMTQPMKSKPTGDVDRDFAAMMAEHHRWAIDMAKIELEHGKNPELKKMAEDVVKAQSAEVEKLEKHAQMKH